MDFDDLLLVTVNLLAGLPGRARALPAAVHARPGRRVPGHQPGPERAGRSCSAGEHRNVVRGRRQRPVGLPAGGAPTSATSSSSSRPSPTRRSIAARAELPLDPDHPRRRQRGHRQQRHPQAEGAVDRGRARASRSSATGPRTSTTRRRGWPPRSPACTTDERPPLRATWPSSTGPTPRAGPSRRRWSGASIPYKVVGGTRFYDRREVKDVLAYLRVLANPDDEVSAPADRQRAQAGGRRHLGGPAGRLGRDARASRSPTPSASAEEAGRDRQGRSAGLRRRCAELLDELRAGWPSTGRRPGGPASRRWPTRTGLPGRARGRGTPSRPHGRIENIDELVGAAGEYEDLDEFLESVGPGRRRRRARRRRHPGLAHDPAHRQGPRVPGRVPGRAWRTGSSPTCGPSASPSSSRRSGGSATSASPGPGSGSTSRTPGAGPCGARPRTTSRRRFLSEIPAELVHDVGVVGSRARRDGARDCRHGLRRRRPDHRGRAALGLAAGDRVVHDRWGEGVVVVGHGRG